MIDSNNEFKKLSKGLLDAVRGVMEAKAGTTPKTEKEKDLAAKAPPHDKITHADVLAGRGVLKKHPVHGKMVVAKEDVEAPAAKVSGLDIARNVLNKMRNEEAEELDELSVDKLKAYRTKARADAYDADDVDDERRYRKRAAGSNTAGKKIVRQGGSLKSEEVEHIDELSTKTLDSYRSKARNQIIAAKNKDTDTTEKRLKGYTQASKNIGKNFVKGVNEEVEDLDEALDAAARYGQHHTAIKDLMKSISQHIENHKSDALKHRDYRGKKGVHWGHVGDLAQVHSQLADIHDRLAQQGEYKKSLGESVEDLDIEQIDELSKATLRSYAQNAKDQMSRSDTVAGRLTGERMAGAKPSAKERFHSRRADKRHAGLGLAIDKLAREEVEQVDEAPVDGVAPGSMANDGHLCATKVFHKEWAEGTPLFSQHAEPDADGNIAWYDVMFEHGIEKMVPTDEMEILMAETHERHGKRKMREGVEEIDEARGRPPKEGSAAWKARQAAAKSGNVEGDEPRQHIIQQLQRAKLSMQGGAKIRFKNGEEHHVHGTHAAKLLDKYAGMKPHEKETFQKKIGASHEGLKSEL